MTSYTGPITCAVCGHTMHTPAAQVGAVAVCAACGASFVVNDDGVSRRATGADTTALSAADLQILRTSRRRTR